MASMDKIAILNFIRKIGLDGDVDFLRERLKLLTQAIMGAEVSELVGAERFEPLKGEAKLQKRIPSQGIEYESRHH
jgi:transposase-like protein